MRDLLDTLQLINESTGLAGRKAGDTFKGSDDTIITFDNITFYPESGKYQDIKELKKNLESLPISSDEIFWQNSMSNRTGGFAIIQFTADDQSSVYVGRFLEQIKPNPTSNYVPNTFTTNGITFNYGGKSAEKTQAGLSPQDLLTNKSDLSADDILLQLSKSLGTKHPLYAVAYRLCNGEPLPMTFPAPKDISFTAFRDYFCEILQPIALAMGQYTGNAGEAAETFLGGSFMDAYISFDTTKTAGLSDSIMSIEDGRNVKISTKGGKGATASSKNLLDSVDELSQTANGRKLIKKYKEVIDMLREVQKQGQAGAPLYLGVKYDIITEEEAELVRNLKKEAPINLTDIEELDLPDNLVELALNRSTDNPGKVSLYYHLLAAIAHKAAIEVNDNTDFSKAASDILNNGALVQVYTKARQGKDNWTLDEFNTVYPGKSIKGVYFSAGKTYYSTGIKGNFTFKIDKGGSKISTKDTVANKGPVIPLAVAAKAIADRPIRSVKKPKVDNTKSNVGREKRK